MKKFSLFLLMIILFISCREDKTIDEPISNPYGVILENCTSGQLYVKSSQLVMGMPEILPGKSTSPIYGNRPTATITYFGDGTHYKTIEKDIILEKDQIIHVRLTYP